MKYIKLFMFLAVASVFAACSDDESSWNTTAGVTVSMQNPTKKVKEGVGLFNVPIVVTGETNGPVKVTVTMRETGANPAKKDVNYLVTDTTIVISEGRGNVEVKTVDDSEPNEDRTFDLAIVSAEGAKVGDNATTTVILRDNDTEPYDRLQGQWRMSYYDGSGNPKSDVVTITGSMDEDDEDYNHVLKMSGILGYSWLTAILSFDYDKDTNQGSVSFDKLGQYVAGGPVEFTTFKGNIYFYRYNGQTTPIQGAWNSDLTKVTFDQRAALQAYVVNAETGANMGTWNALQVMVLTR